MGGKLPIIWVIGVLTLLVVFVFFFLASKGGVIDSGSIMSVFTGIKDNLVGNALGGTLDPTM